MGSDFNSRTNNSNKIDINEINENNYELDFFSRLNNSSSPPSSLQLSAQKKSAKINSNNYRFPYTPTVTIVSNPVVNGNDSGNNYINTNIGIINDRNDYIPLNINNSIPLPVLNGNINPFLNGYNNNDNGNSVAVITDYYTEYSVPSFFTTTDNYKYIQPLYEVSHQQLPSAPQIKSNSEKKNKKKKQYRPRAKKMIIKASNGEIIEDGVPLNSIETPNNKYNSAVDGLLHRILSEQPEKFCLLNTNELPTKFVRIQMKMKEKFKLLERSKIIVEEILKEAERENEIDTK